MSSCRNRWGRRCRRTPARESRTRYPRAPRRCRCASDTSSGCVCRRGSCGRLRTASGFRQGPVGRLEESRIVHFLRRHDPVDEAALERPFLVLLQALNAHASIVVEMGPTGLFEGRLVEARMLHQYREMARRLAVAVQLARRLEIRREKTLSRLRIVREQARAVQEIAELEIL